VTAGPQLLLSLSGKDLSMISPQTSKCCAIQIHSPETTPGKFCLSAAGHDGTCDLFIDRLKAFTQRNPGMLSWRFLPR
jgi:hypothetical protein